MTVCKILEGILPKESVRGAPPPPDKKLLEHHFVFACVWAFGGCMLVDKVYDYRSQFSKWWISEWKTVQFPEKGLVSGYGTWGRGKTQSATARSITVCDCLEAGCKGAVCCQVHYCL